METITINDVLYALLTVALPLVLRYVFQYVSAKYADSKYSAAINAVFSAVEYVNQTFVDSLKQSGCFDATAQEAAFVKAKDAALEVMDASTKKWLEKTFTDMDEWLTVQIESAVKAVKKDG